MGPLHPVPPGTLVPQQQRRPVDRWHRARRWFLVNSALAGLIALVSGRRVAQPLRAPADQLYRPPPQDNAAASTALTPYVDALPIPPVRRPDPDGTLTVTLTTTEAQLHSELPPTTLWSFDGGPVGPTIQVRRGDPVRIAWRNELRGPLPVMAAEVADNPGPVREWDLPGLRGAEPIDDVASVPPHTAIHLYGALDGGAAAGWPESPVAPGATQLSGYANAQPAATLWYRDATADVSRFTTTAGLHAGLYLIRDLAEDALGLPTGDRELALVLCDRNLDTDAGGRPTGTPLYKTVATDTAAGRERRPFTGPFTLVNGKIQPFVEVAPGRYRLRVLNAAAGRVYRLQLPSGIPVTVLGGDAGLLAEPAALDGPLVLAPGERADLLADFGAAPGTNLELRDASSGAANPGILQVRVAAGPPEPAPAPPARLIEPDPQADPVRERYVVLTADGNGLHEMAPTDPDAADVELAVHDERGGILALRRVAGHHRDPITVTPLTRDAERWTWINLATAGEPTPVHVRGFGFRVLRRAHNTVSGTSLTWASSGDLAPHERGPKDVVAVGPGELVEVVGRFVPEPGRFQHGCCGADRADLGLVRPLTVTPPGIAALDPHRTR